MLLDELVITEAGEKVIRQLSERHGVTMARLARLSRPLMGRLVSRVAASDGSRTLAQTLQEFALYLRAEWEQEHASERDLRPAFAVGLETMVCAYDPTQRIVEKIALSCEQSSSIGPAAARYLAWRLQLLICDARGAPVPGMDNETVDGIAELLRAKPLPVEFFEAAGSEDALQAFAVLLGHRARGSDPDRDLIRTLSGLHPDYRTRVQHSAAAMLALTDPSQAIAPR